MSQRKGRSPASASVSALSPGRRRSRPPVTSATAPADVSHGPRWRQRAGCCFRFPMNGCGGAFLESPALCQFRDPISVLVVPTLVSLGPPILQALFPENRFMSRFLKWRLWRTFWTSTSQGQSGGLSVVWGHRGAGMASGCPTGSMVIVVGPSLYPFTFHICCMRFFWTCPACHVTCMYLRTGKLILLI